MTNTGGAAALESERSYWLERRNHLFIASCMALIVTAMSFAIRGDIMGPWGDQFKLTKEQVGQIAAMAFWGFTLSMVIGGPLCDTLGMGRIMVLAFVGHLAGILVTIFATSFTMLFIGTTLIGIANGFVEAACNPLIATLYSDQKIRRLNLFHVWFPGGIVIGGLLSYFVSHAGDGQTGGFVLPGLHTAWQTKMALMLIPLAIYGAMIIGKKFPSTERVASGVSNAEMWKACATPLFLLFVFCMLMTAVTELGPGQWIPDILTITTGQSGILFLVVINGIMMLGRTFAGPIVHRVSPVGMLLGSACFAAVGLTLLSSVRSAGSATIAAVLFAIGVCFFWPTMLGTVSERFPRTGSLGLAIMGGLGNAALGVAQPAIGRTYDGAAQASAHLTATQYAAAIANKTLPNDAKIAGGAEVFKAISYLPMALVVIFLLIFLYDKSRGGYRKEELTNKEELDVAGQPQF